MIWFFFLFEWDFVFWKETVELRSVTGYCTLMCFMRLVITAPHLYIQSYCFHGKCMSENWYLTNIFHCINFRLNCHYANCSTPYPSFSCKFMTANGSLLAHATNEHCRHILLNHRLHYSNTTTHYRCILTRKKRREEKNITINYNVCRGKSKWKKQIIKRNVVTERTLLAIIFVPLSPDCIKSCHNMMGLLLHQGPAALWPVVFMSLWRIFNANSPTWGRKRWHADKQKCICYT